MKTAIILLALVGSLAFTSHARAASATVTINSQSPGPTPFIQLLDLTVSPADALESIQFTVDAKPESVTRPVSATYSSAYLQRRGFLNPDTGQVTLPIFGLYANYSNAVFLTFQFNTGGTQRDAILMPAPAFADPIGIYTNPTVTQARSMTTKLSYDFILLKGYISPQSPTIIDTDGEVRWVGTAGLSSISAIMYANGIYISSDAGLIRMELDGAFESLADYSSLGVTSTGHHNFDFGKFGIILDVNTTNAIESVNLEVDAAGNVLKSWDLAQIIRNAMLADGDDPSDFVREGEDWFHNNATTYRKSDDTLIISGREDFVIAVDYTTLAIQWILGDPTKKWYQYPSLRQYALTLAPGTLPPIGQHSVSITKDNSLLLFDNGATSQNQDPKGDSRSYSTPRKYRIKSLKKSAQEIWSFPRAKLVSSPFCSSIYEDKKKNYLINYSMSGPFLSTEIIGLDSKGATVFHYQYPAIGCATSWNAQPIHLENLVFE